MAKILFINPAIRMEDVPRHVPYGMALLAAVCDRAGHQVQVFDANAWRPPIETIREVLQADSWDLVALGGITTTYGYVKMLVGEIEQLSPRPRVLVGGGLMTSIPHDMMRLLPGIDIGSIGEGIETLPEILDFIDAGRTDWENVLGIAWRDEAGKAHLNPNRPLMHDLDQLPYPAWDYFPLEEVYFKNSEVTYSEEGMKATRRLDINASYGCSLFCRYCFHLGLIGDMTVYDKKDGERDIVFTRERNYRFHSPDYIINMVRHIRDKYNVDFVGFFDENLMTINTATGGWWLKELCEKWIESGLYNPETREGVHWSGTSHAKLANPEILKLMKRAGCSHLVYGLESFNDRVLKNIGKGSTVQDNERAIRITMEAGIRPLPNQMMGFPDEFFDSIIDSIDAWDRLGIEVKPFFVTPYPGCEWYYTYKDRILEQYNGDLEAFLLDLGDATEITAVISENFNAVELLGLRELMVKRDRRRIKEYEKHWRKVNGEPKLPVFRAAGWKKNLEELKAGQRETLYELPKMATSAR